MNQRARRHRGWALALVAVGAVVASCTADGGVSEVESNGAPERTDPEGASVDGSTPIAPPDPTGLPTVTEPDPEILIGELDNGLRYLIRDNDNPGGRVDMRLVVDAGSALETDAQAGGAHFLEHMLFNGTEQFPENELIDVLRGFGAAFGADVNAYTSYDETVYELTMPTQDPATVDTGLDVLQQWLSSATIDPAQVEAERGVILDEWRGSEGSSDGRIYNGLEELFLTGSPYEDRDPIGSDAAITGMTAEPLRAFYDDWYRPDNAAVVVVGDVDPADIEDGIRDRFGSLGPRGESPPRPELTIAPATAPRVVIVSEPDVAEGFAQVTLPTALPGDDVTPEARLQQQILDSLLFDIIATRLGNDALRGEAPFDDAQVASSAVVRPLDAPEIVVSADGESMAAATQAVFDEYERVRRYGVTEAEVARAVSTVRAASDSQYEGRDSRQDAQLAEEYVRYVLTDEPIPTADAAFEFVGEVLDRATPETVAYGFVNRLATAGAHVMVVVPESEAAAVPGADVFEAQALGMRDRQLEPRTDEAAIEGELMVPPDPVEEVSSESLANGKTVSFVAPEVLEFANGVTVSLNPTDIVEGQVAFEARSPGGLAVVDDADVGAADAIATVVTTSGVATYDQVSLEAFLADTDVMVQLGVDSFTEGMFGSAATSDLEVLFQLIHLYMTQPRVDPVALEQYVDDELAYASDPSIDPGYAEYEALLDARYDDPRYLLPTVESLSAVTAEDIERVMSDRFGDSSDFSFAFSGDFDPDEVTDLARRYLGTLPATGREESVDYVEPPPPDGVVTSEVTAGTGEQASLSFLFTAPASAERRDDVLAFLVQEIVTNRLNDTIREELGDSYSPFASVQIGRGASPSAETYISNTTGPELVAEVDEAVLGELDDLRRNGPTEVELDSARETVRQQLDLFSNEQINDEVLSLLTDPGGTEDFDDFLEQVSLVDEISDADIREALSAWLPADRYISVVVRPR